MNTEKGEHRKNSYRSIDWIDRDRIPTERLTENLTESAAKLYLQTEA